MASLGVCGSRLEGAAVNVGALGDILVIDEGYEATAASAEREVYDAIKEAPGATQAG